MDCFKRKSSAPLSISPTHLPKKPRFEESQKNVPKRSGAKTFSTVPKVAPVLNPLQSTGPLPMASILSKLNFHKETRSQAESSLTISTFPAPPRPLSPEPSQKQQAPEWLHTDTRGLSMAQFKIVEEKRKNDMARRRKFLASVSIAVRGVFLAEVWGRWITTQQKTSESASNFKKFHEPTEKSTQGLQIRQLRG